MSTYWPDPNPIPSPQIIPVVVQDAAQIPDHLGVGNIQKWIKMQPTAQWPNVDEWPKGADIHFGVGEIGIPLLSKSICLRQ